MSSVPPANSGDNNAQRRSQRVTVKVSVAVLAQGPDNKPPFESEQREVGLDFVKASPGFWRISFPPPDWTTESPEAKGSTKKKK
jgi:hypothetical protein